LTVVSRDAGRAQALGAGIEVVEADLTRPGEWQKRVDGCDAVVHLAGAGVGDRRWNTAYRKLLVDSRVESTRRIVDAIQDAGTRPPVLVNASAVGYYGACGDTPLDESAPAGDDFLAGLTRQWETQAARAGRGPTRVTMLRIAVVLDPRGAALGKMLPVFRLGLGGPLGSGRQYFPWIHWRDVIGLIGFVLDNESVSGPLNVVAPDAVTNLVFTRTLGRVLHRPAVLPVPALMLRLAIGEMGRYVVASQRVVAERAIQAGYTFAFDRLQPALEDLLR
jgi:uncharacterized protein (TIGR01777 family)